MTRRDEEGGKGEGVALFPRETPPGFQLKPVFPTGSSPVDVIPDASRYGGDLFRIRR